MTAIPKGSRKRRVALSLVDCRPALAASAGFSLGLLGSCMRRGWKYAGRYGRQTRLREYGAFLHDYPSCAKLPRLSKRALLPEKTSAAPTEGSLPHAGGIVLRCPSDSGRDVGRRLVKGRFNS